MPTTRLLSLVAAAVILTQQSTAQRPDPLAIWRSTLARYEQLAVGTTWSPLLRPAVVVRAGEPYADARALHERLMLLGDLPPDTTPPDAPVLSPVLVEGLRHFQSRHQLNDDGVLGPLTYAALTVPLSTRVAQLQQALAVMTETATSTAPTILVSVPTAELWAWSEGPWHGAPALTMRVIVGAPRTPTPTMSADIESVTFRPYWNVPSSIASAELWPLIRKDPGYLDRHHYDVVNGTGLRQRPGPDNALGLVRFDVRSTLGVHLHDTPARQLFMRSNRALSHGCVRVQHPAALASWLLAVEGWTPAMVDAAMHDVDNRRVPLRAPVQLRIVAAPAAVHSDGTAVFGAPSVSPMAEVLHSPQTWPCDQAGRAPSG